DISLPIREFDERQRFVASALEGVAQRLHFNVLDVGQHLCTKDACMATRENVSLYVDDNHLSRSGAMEVRGLFASAFESSLSRRASEERTPSDGEARGKPDAPAALNPEIARVEARFWRE